MKIRKLITVNPKMEFSIDYKNQYGNVETFIVPTTGIKFDLIPTSEDLENKIKFYKFQGSIKEIEEETSNTAAKSTNPFAQKSEVKESKESKEVKSEEVKVEEKAVAVQQPIEANEKKNPFPDHKKK